MPAVMNAANEVAVRKFLTGEVAFTDIPTLIAETMRRHTMPEGEPTLEDILRADTWARACVEEIA
jgi:1-deoxy-D-xylulose-5-phosphate reductoisomerase